MPYILKQSTASQEVVLGPFLDDTDGKTAETGLTIANTDILLHKTGGTTLPAKNSGGATHISNGLYYAVLDATDTDTLGPLVIYCHVSGALPVRLECDVLAANVFDARYGTDKLQVDTVEISGDSTDIASIASGVAAAIKLTTGWTAGGTLTYAEVVKIIAAAVAGKVIDKAGVAGTVQHLDVEDKTTPIFENIPSNTTSPYRDPTIL